jgi:subtilisin family serine protease
VGIFSKSFFLFFVLTTLSNQSFAFDKCGRRIEEGRRGFFSFYECNEHDQLVSRKVFKEWDFIEENFHHPGELKPFKRRILKSDQVTPADYFFTYKSDEENDLSLKSVTVKSFDGVTLGSHKVELSEEEVNSFSPNANLDPKILIIDSGFSFTHPSLKDYVFYNSDEALNDEDSDGDGIKDNVLGFHGVSEYEGSADYTSNINEPLKLKPLGAPLSHGTAVADVAVSELETIGFIGMSGDFHSPAFLYKALEIINKHNIIAVNLSFGFGDRSQPGPISESSYDAMAGLIMSARDTLFVIASGNSGINFDESNYSEFPACLRGSNVITVGALNTNSIAEDKKDHYQAASISNVGRRCVDFYAPGENIQAAAVGDVKLTATGTSFAAPYTVNKILKVYEENPNLNVREIREILEANIYVPTESELPSRLGGFLNM